MRRLAARDLIELVTDANTWVSWDSAPDHSQATPDYAAELATASTRASTDESVVSGEALIDGIRAGLIIGEFGFLAGSVGRAAADRIVAGIERATAEGLPLIGMPISGGTRMQEGTPAFVQMARIAAAIARHKAAHLPYIAYLRNPTTGGVMATWGSLAQVTAAEPEALLGFLGPRVYEVLYGEPFPSGVQVSENLVEHGIIDAVVPHEGLRAWLGALLSLLASPGLDTPGLDTTPSASLDPATRPTSMGTTWEAITATRRPDRPGAREVLAAATAFVELSGTGAGERDPGIVLALASFAGQSCVVVAQDRVAQASRPFGPGGLRTARRGMRLAAELQLPFVTLIDTVGAELSKDAEEGAIAGEIARCLADLTTLPAPTISVLLGEGNGGGALALFPADRVLAAANSWLSPLPPEGASAIVHRDTNHAAEMAAAQQVSARDMAERGLVDRLIDESGDLTANVVAVLADEIANLRARTTDALLTSRLDRYRN